MPDRGESGPALDDGSEAAITLMLAMGLLTAAILFSGLRSDLRFVPYVADP